MPEEHSGLDPLPTPVQPVPVTDNQPASSSSSSPSPTNPTNGYAIAALVVGIVAAITWFIPIWGLVVGITAVVLGFIGARKPKGKGMAVAGVVTGGFGAILALIFTAFFIVSIVANSSANNERFRAIESQQNEAQSAIDGKKDFAKGETANLADIFELTINSSERNYVLESGRTPAQGKQFALVNITVKNISEESEQISAAKFGAINNGLKVPSVIAAVPDGLQSGQLEPGATLTGNLLYEVPSDATDLKLAYERVAIDKSFKTQRITYTLAF